MNEPIIVDQVQQMVASLSLMAMPKKIDLELSDEIDKREELFVLKIQVKQEVINAIIDTGSQKNPISEQLVQKLGLAITPHPKPYPLVWIHKENELQIRQQCTFKFAVTSQYIHEVTCEVVPLDICQFILGSPYLWDRDAIFYKR